MTHFDHIHVRGFRRLVDLDLDLRRLNVLIGANGSGKTSLLDVLGLLGASAAGELNRKLSELGGINSILTSGGTGEMSFALATTNPGASPVTYDFTMKAQGIAYQIASERLGNADFAFIEARNGNAVYKEARYGSAVRSMETDDRLETALSRVPKNLQPLEEVRRFLASFVHYHELEVGPRSPVRLPQPLRPATLPGRNGEDLVSCLFSMQQTERDRFGAIEDALRLAFPGFVRLEFPPVAAGTLALTWRDSNFSHPFYMHQLSEGTLRFLWLATLLQSPDLTGVVLIDEPEVSLHPELLSILAELLREASSRSQVFVATHADRLVRFLEPGEVVVLDVAENGAVQAQRADQLDLDEWLKDYTLDEVWRLGRMGGRA
ncbi:MAG: AAA family ATPase [Isosphaeraceae bacterium]